MEHNEETNPLNTDLCITWRDQIIPETDWLLLIDQKEELIDMLKTADYEQSLALRGIINFLNHIQQAASETLSEGMVYDKTCKTCNNPMILTEIETLTPHLDLTTNNPDFLSREKWECPECEIRMRECPESKY